ncbi:DUF3515 family protein [Naasia lichenicola]|uniref:DUF3515 family protein n=1 Tax=Naasia lichenicola TaxID=2565933 RepID=UPI001E448770|nr:DUF3515 family protein [Naasia lichenicola]
MLRSRSLLPAPGRTGTRIQTRLQLAQRIAGITAVVILSTGLAACSPTVSLEPGPEATATACADVIVRLPDTLDGADKRETNAQGTAAWGDPSSVLLVCGVTQRAPTTDRCIAIGDGASEVDWVEDDSKAPVYSYISYNRAPAVEVTIDSTKSSGTDVLTDLSDVVSILALDHPCVGAEDAELVPSTPAP